MRSEFTSGADRVDADGVHPTKSIAAASVALKKAGFKFLGETTTLSWFQAAGLVNHHKPACFRWQSANAEFDATVSAIGLKFPTGIHDIGDASVGASVVDAASDADADADAVKQPAPAKKPRGRKPKASAGKK